MNAQKYVEKDPVIARIAEKKETAWINPYFLPFDMTNAVCQLVVSYENFKSIYPRLSRSSIYFRPFGYMSIVVYFEDGMKMVYDDLRKQAYITA